MPQQIERSANNALGELLQGMLSRSRVHSENTQAIAVRGVGGWRGRSLDVASAALLCRVVSKAAMTSERWLPKTLR